MNRVFGLKPHVGIGASDTPPPKSPRQMLRSTARYEPRSVAYPGRGRRCYAKMTHTAWNMMHMYCINLYYIHIYNNTYSI